MGEFDPYQHWLEIPRAEQPPNHYRLLGIRLFENDLRAIERAAQQRAMLLRSIELETHVDAAQRLLNEVATAGACLLTPERKQRYDLALRGRSAPALVTTPTPQFSPVAKPRKTAAAKPPSPPAVTRSRMSTAVSDLLDEMPKLEPKPLPPDKWAQWQKRLTHLAYVLIGIVVAAAVLTLLVWIVDQIAPQDLGSTSDIAP